MQKTVEKEKIGSDQSKVDAVSLPVSDKHKTMSKVKEVTKEAQSPPEIPVVEAVEKVNLCTCNQNSVL